MSQNDLIAINANDPQLPQLDLLVRTLRDPQRGDFCGRIVLLTTGVAPETKAHLTTYGVEVFESDLAEFVAWPFAPVIGAYEFLKKRVGPRALVSGAEASTWPESETASALAPEEQALTQAAFDLAADPSQRQLCADEFGRYMLKHFSKFGLLGLLERDAGRIDRVMVLDSDIIVQGQVARIFETVTPGQCLVEYEKEAMMGDYFVARSNTLALRFPRAHCLRFGPDAHEVNVGFLCAEADLMRTLLLEWKELMFHGGLERLFVLHRDDFWHEQDFFRLLHDTTPERFRAAGKELVYHAVHAATADIAEHAPGDFRLRATGVRPMLVHFAGGYWKRFPSMGFFYGRKREMIVPPLDGLRTFIFGAGTDCLRLLKTPEAHPNEIVLGLLDNTPAKQGRTFWGQRVFAPDNLALFAYDRIRIASSATTAIYRQLLALGVSEEKIVSPLLESANRRRLEALRGCHRGRPAVIVGNGPSLQMADLDALAVSDAVTFAFNKIFLAFDRTAFRPSYYMVEDFLVAENNAAAIDALRGIPKLFPEVLLRWVKQDEDTTLFGLKHQDPDAGIAEFSEDPLDICWGGTVAYSALELAFCMGCNPVYLIGMDFKFDVPTGALSQVLAAGTERNHFLPNYRQPGERWNKPMIEFNQIAYRAAQAHADRTGRRIFNATRGGALEVFPRIDFYRVFPPSGKVASP